MSIRNKMRQLTGRPLARRSVANLAIKVFSIPVGVAVSAWLARELTVQDFGLYGVVLSLFMIGAMPVVFALSNLSIREIGTGLTAGDRDTALGVMLYSLMVMGVASVAYLVLVILAGLMPILPEYRATFAALGHTLWLYPLFLMTAVGGAFLRGMHRVALGILPEQLLRQLLFLMFLPVAMLATDSQRDVAWVLQVQTYAMFGAALFAMGLAWRVSWHQIGRVESRFVWHEWNASLTPFLLLGFVQICNSQMGMVILGAFNFTADAAYYRVADQLSSLATLPLLAVNLAFGPLVSSLRGGKDRVGIQAGLTAASKLIWLLTLPALLLLCLAPGAILAWLFGETYREAASVLVVLCFGAAFNAVLGPVALTLNMLGHERETLRGMWIALAINVVLAILLTPWLGGLGAALAATATKMIWNILLFRCLYRLEGYSTLPFLLKPRIQNYEKT